ncbi:MAG: SCP2 sterol-binding domain-containing protein [Pseudomonadota bacterium]
MLEQRIKEIIEVEIAKDIKKRASEVKKLGDVVIAIEMTDLNNQTWLIDCRNSPPSVKAGTMENPDLHVSLASPDFIEIYEGRLKAESAFFTGKIKLKGSMGLAMRLGTIIKR